jgi:YbbR domain-containing protein
MQKSVKKFITVNPWLKLASILLAILLWFLVVSQGRSVIVVDVPVGFKNIPENLETVNGPKAVSLSIEGQERLLKKLKKEDISVIIDLSDVKEGDTAKEGNVFIPLSAQNVTLPNMLTVVDISPQTVKLKIEEKVRKNVPVRTIIVGSPAQSFDIQVITVVPRMVEIKGTKSVIKKIHSVKTEPIDITGITANLQSRVYIDLSKNNVKVNITEVDVSIAVKKKSE